MDVREKLVEIVKKAAYSSLPSNTEDFHLNMFVMNLLAHGVTVQDWVSVTERLPEETGRYLTANKRGDDKIDVFDLWFDGGFWYIDDEDDMFDYEVTHWMPMPVPPKGE